MNPDDFEKHAMSIAVARYGVIAPVVSRKLTDEELHQEFRKIVSSTHKFPDGHEVMISERTARRWHHWYMHGRCEGSVHLPPGAEALKPLQRNDQGTTRALLPELIERAVRLRSEEPKRNTAALIRLIRSEAEARGEEPPCIKEATLAYHLRQRGATRKRLKREGRVFPRYEHVARNDVWQGDFSQGIALPNPLESGKTKMTHLHVFIDDHTRYIVHGEFYLRQNLPCLEDCFRKAILKGGIPSSCYWDNGAAYQAKQIQLLAARLGTQVIFATPYHPEGKGKCERFFRTAKESFYPEARRANLQSLEELNTFFWAWLEEAYHDRLHSETKQTPRQRWEAGASGVRMPEPASLVDLFLWEETRKVDKAGCIQMSGNSYPVAEHLVRETVTVRFDPFDMSQIRVLHRGVFVGASAPLKLVCHTFRKALPDHVEKPAPLESSVAFRKQMSQGYRQKVDGVLEQARSTRAGSHDGLLTRAEFVTVVSEALENRSFSVIENNLLTDFFSQYAPLQKALVHQALLRAIEEKGSHRHVRFYLDAVRTGKRAHGGV